MRTLTVENMQDDNGGQVDKWLIAMAAEMCHSKSCTATELARMLDVLSDTLSKFVDFQ